MPALEVANAARRGFLRWATLFLGLLASAFLAVPLVGYLLGTLRKPPEQWIGLGELNKFPKNQTTLHTFENKLGAPWDGKTAFMGVYVRFLGIDPGKKEQFLVFAMNCAHLGCPVTWFPQSGLFMCPCHGGVYYEDGKRASGPPTRGLFECVWRVRDGQLEVQAPHLPTLQNTLTEPARV